MSQDFVVVFAQDKKKSCETISFTFNMWNVKPTLMYNIESAPL